MSENDDSDHGPPSEAKVAAAAEERRVLRCVFKSCRLRCLLISGFVNFVYKSRNPTTAKYIPFQRLSLVLLISGFVNSNYKSRNLLLEFL
jgi:hypothetical protein